MTALEAWNDIQKTMPELQRDSVSIAHTKYYWRWKLNRLRKTATYSNRKYKNQH